MRSTSLVAVLCYTSMYTLRAVPVPVPLRALTAGYQSARFSFMAEPVFQLRKWLIMIAGVCVRMYVCASVTWAQSLRYVIQFNQFGYALACQVLPCTVHTGRCWHALLCMVSYTSSL